MAGYGVSGRSQIADDQQQDAGLQCVGLRSDRRARLTGWSLVAGVLVNNVFSFGGTPGLGGTRYNTVHRQPFVNYNFGEGWYVGTCPIITANWLTSGNNAWTLPVGAAVGRVVKIGGKLPVNFQIGAYYNALRPKFGSTWQLRTQVTLIF